MSQIEEIRAFVMVVETGASHRLPKGLASLCLQSAAVSKTSSCVLARNSADDTPDVP